MKAPRYLTNDVQSLAAEMTQDLSPARLREIADRLIRLGNELHGDTSWRVSNSDQVEAAQ